MGIASQSASLRSPRSAAGETNRRAPLDAMEAMAVTAPCARGEEIYGPDDAADHWYRIVRGMARQCAVMSDGRRQIVDFLLPNDFFGFTASRRHDCAVEAVVEGTVIASYPRRRLELLADSDSAVGRRIRELAFEANAQMVRRLLILGRTSAVEKVGGFLLEMAERTADGMGEAVVLPMSRYDIADYLALSAETVSRALSALKQRAAIAVTGIHRVEIVDRDALEEATGCGVPL